jgi:hypothetical protein
MKPLKLIIYLSLSLIISGCNDKCLNSLGDQSSEFRDLKGFDKISVGNKINLFISIDSAYSLRIDGGENILHNISTEVDGEGWLTISDQNTCDWFRTYDHEINMYVSLPELVHLFASNTGNIIGLDTIRTKVFRFDQQIASGINELTIVSDTSFIKLHTGTGDMTCFGETKKLYIYSSSYGYVDCKDFYTPEAWVTARNSGDVQVYSSDTLEAYIHSEGNIHLYGGADKIFLERDGIGELIHED